MLDAYGHSSFGVVSVGWKNFALNVLDFKS